MSDANASSIYVFTTNINYCLLLAPLINSLKLSLITQAMCNYMWKHSGKTIYLQSIIELVKYIYASLKVLQRYTNRHKVANY